MNEIPYTLSIVLPVYRELKAVDVICQEVSKFQPRFKGIEIIIVNDGNINNEIYHGLNRLKREPQIKVIHLSRNFGQHVAIAAGMKNARGDYILVSDADLQYTTDDIMKLAAHGAGHQYDAVLSVITQSQHDRFDTWTSKAYYVLMRKLFGAPYRSDLGSVFLVSRHVQQGLLNIHDRYRMTIPMIYWLMGDIQYFPISHCPRPEGRSGYTFSKKLRHAINGATSFSSHPLLLSVAGSALFALLMMCILVGLLVRHFLLGENYLPGWLSTLLVLLASSSITLACLGIIGVYVGRMFESINGRPLYFVQKENREDSQLFEERGPS